MEEKIYDRARVDSLRPKMLEGPISGKFQKLKTLSTKTEVKSAARWLRKKGIWK